jgi:hypothetical protein
MRCNSFSIVSTTSGYISTVIGEAPHSLRCTYLGGGEAGHPLHLLVLGPRGPGHRPCRGPQGDSAQIPRPAGSGTGRRRRRRLTVAHLRLRFFFPLS